MFRVRACETARVALSRYHGNYSTNAYEVVIGGWKNTKTVIRRSLKGPIKAETPTVDILSCDYFRTFWLRQILGTAAAGLIEIGTGTTIGQGTFHSWLDPDPYTVTSVSLSTGNGAKGVWEILHTQSRTYITYIYVPYPQLSLRLQKQVV